MTIRNTTHSPHLSNVASTSTTKRTSTTGAGTSTGDTAATSDANAQQTSRKPTPSGLVGSHVDTTA